jgi:hypothetical protein
LYDFVGIDLRNVKVTVISGLVLKNEATMARKQALTISHLLLDFFLESRWNPAQR